MDTNLGAVVGYDVIRYPISGYVGLQLLDYWFRLCVVHVVILEKIQEVV